MLDIEKAEKVEKNLKEESKQFQQTILCLHVVEKERT